MAYSGYLVPHVKLVEEWRGQPALFVANHLYEIGVRATNLYSYASPNDHIEAIAAMVRYVWKGGYKPKKKAKWQVWTPEMQEDEIQRERG